MRAYTASKRCNKDGITLVEVLVAILIFTICIGGMCRLGVSVRETSDRARDHYTAINIAKSRLERVKTFEFDQLPYFVENEVRVDENGTPDTDGLFRRSTTVTDVKSNLRNVTVSVEMLNRVTLAFDGEDESIMSYVADFLDIPDET